MQFVEFFYAFKPLIELVEGIGTMYSLHLIISLAISIFIQLQQLCGIIDRSLQRKHFAICNSEIKNHDIYQRYKQIDSRLKGLLPGCLYLFGPVAAKIGRDEM